MSKMQISMLLMTLCGILTKGNGGLAPAGSDGSKCPNVSCSPPTAGIQCTPKYERDDGCCPVWYCNKNGVPWTIYDGKSSGNFRHTSSEFLRDTIQFQLPGFGNLFG